MFKKVESKNYRNYTDDKSGIQLEVNGEVDMSNAYAMAFNITFNTFPSKNHEKGYSAIVNLLDQKAIQRYVREVSELTKINTNILTASLNYIREDINEYKRNQKSRIVEVGSTSVGITDKAKEEIEYYLSDKNLIAQLINDFNGIGISGNPDAVLLLYIACISRLTDLPIVLNCYGQTDIVRKLIEIIPSEFKIQMDSISANAPFYLTDKSKNKLIAVSSQNLTITEIDYLLKLSRNGLSKIQSNKNRVGEFITNSISADAGASIVFTSTKEKKLNKQGVYNIEISLSKEDEEKVKAVLFKPTIQIGILGEYKIPNEYIAPFKNLILQVEILYTNPGYSERLTFNNSNSNYIDKKINVSYNCIQLPIQVKIKSEGKVKRYYMLGLAPTILFSESETNLLSSPKIYVNKINTKYDNIVNGSILNTFGLEFNIGKIGSFVDFRYVQGITNIGKTNSKVANVNIQFFLSTGVKF
jgi:hypothetical protein